MSITRSIILGRSGFTAHRPSQSSLPGVTRSARYTLLPPSRNSGVCIITSIIRVMAVGADFHCSKHKVEPKWEDPTCVHGGKWTVMFARGKSDASWLYMLLAMIGEQVDRRDEICGAVVSVRSRQEKIALWTRNASNVYAQLSTGKQWKEILDYQDSIGYIIHDDAKRLDRAAKNRYTV